jgi:hypothetical protein
MKHLKNINEYLSNINEGVNYNNSKDADMYDVGFTVLQSQIKDIGEIERMPEADVEKAAEEALKNAKPVALTGDAKKDIASMLDYLKSTFVGTDVELDVDNTKVDSSNFENELFIPVGDTEYYFSTSINYEEIAMNSSGKEMILAGAFGSEKEGILDFLVHDLSNKGEVLKACQNFKEYLDNNK